MCSYLLKYLNTVHANSCGAGGRKWGLILWLFLLLFRFIYLLSESPYSKCIRERGSNAVYLLPGTYSTAIIGGKSMRLHFVAKCALRFFLCKNISCNMPCRFVPVCFCVYVSTLLMFLFMEACLEREPVSTKQRAVRRADGSLGAWSLRLIIRCFYGELPDFLQRVLQTRELEEKQKSSSGSRQAGLSPALVITLINNHDQSFWWMGLNLLLMTGGVWGRKRGVDRGDTGCWGEEDRREMNCSAPLRARTLPFSR